MEAGRREGAVSAGQGDWEVLRWDYRHGGKRLTMALGVYPEINLKTARKRRDAGRMLLDAGQDPMAEKTAAKRAVEVEAASTFKGVAMEWHQMKAKSGSSVRSE